MGHKHSFSKKTAWLVKHEQGGVILFIFLLLFFPLIEGKLSDKDTIFKGVGTKKLFFSPNLLGPVRVQ